MRKLIIFDLDGTLIDTPSGIVEAFQYVFRTMQGDEKNHAEIRNTIGQPLERAMANLMGVDLADEKIVQGIELYQKAFKEIILPKAQQLIFPGVEKGMSELLECNYLLAIATSKYYKSAIALLKAAKMDSYFNMIVGADQINGTKSDGEMGFKIMKELKVAPENTVMIGDTTHDIQMAHSANIMSIAVTYGVHSEKNLLTQSPTFLSHTFDDVIELIKKHIPNA